MKSSKIFFEHGYYRISIVVEEIKVDEKKPGRLVMTYTKKPAFAAIKTVGNMVESYCSDDDATIPNSMDVDVMLRNFKRILKGRDIAPEGAFTRHGCLLGFFNHVRTWNPSKNKLL